MNFNDLFSCIGHLKTMRSTRQSTSLHLGLPAKWSLKACLEQRGFFQLEKLIYQNIKQLSESCDELIQNYSVL